MLNRHRQPPCVLTMGRIGFSFFPSTPRYTPGAAADLHFTRLLTAYHFHRHLGDGGKGLPQLFSGGVL